MKRVLSMILAFALAISLLPAMAVSAETPGEYDVICDFDALNTAEHKGTQSKWTADYLSNAGFPFIFSDKGCAEWRNNNTADSTVRATMTRNLWPGSKSRWNAAALNVTIPKSGYYTVKFRGALGASSGETSIYIGENYLGNYDFRASDSDINAKRNAVDSVTGEEKTLNTVYLSEGTHTVIFWLRSTHDLVEYPVNTYLFFKKLSFTYSGETAPGVSGLSATVPETIGVGEKHAFTVDAVMSDGSVLQLADYNSDGTVNADKITVDSSNEAAVKVTSVVKGADNNANNTASYSIEAVNEGEATLTYTLYQNNTVVKTITNVIIVDAEKKNDVICDFDGVYSKFQGNLTQTVEEFKTAGFPFSINHNGLAIDWKNSTTTWMRVNVSASKLWPVNPTNRIAKLNVELPADGYYSVIFQGRRHKEAAKTNIFMDAVWNGSKYTEGEYLGEYDFIDTNAVTMTASEGPEKILNTVYLTKGTHTVSFLHSEALETNLYLTFKKLSFIYEGTVKPEAKTLTSELPAEALEIGDTEDLTASVTMSDDTPLYLGDYLSTGTADTANRLDVTSENSDIVKVTSVAKGGLCNSENTNYSVEAVAGGTTNLVYTLYRDGEKPVTWKKAITVNEKKVKLMADKNGDGNVTGDELSDVTIGKETSVTATGDREFAYWTDADGGFVSEQKTYTFTPYTNTVLLAVYKDTDAAEEEKIGVDFFDGNRDYLGFVSAEKDTTFGALQNKPTPSLIGYQFLNWSLKDDTVIDKLLTAVAIYEEDGEAIAGGVTVNDETIQTPAYGTKIERTVSDAKAWKRTIGGTEVTVAYGDSYEYYVWDDTAITAITANTTAAPLVVLDDPAHGAYMIEYDNGGVTALEAGILFGDEDSTVDSCYAKAKVKEISNHGQFTAKPAAESSEKVQTHVRGYLIYKDAKGVIKTIYTDPAAINN